MNLLKRISVGAVAVLALPVVSLMFPASSAMAWGPERPTYTMAAPADHATFNSITDNALIGDERDFVRIVEKGVNDEYTSDLTIEAGKQYQVYIYYHNDASETFNTLDKGQVGVARDVRMVSSFPQELAKNEREAIVGKITSSSATPEEVWDEAYVTAREALTLHYVEGSLKIYNRWHQDGLLLSAEHFFSPKGTFIGTQDMNGLIYGCDVFSGSVSYTIQTKAVEKPTTPDPEPEKPTVPTTPEEPELPKELPNTGPVEIGLAIVLILVIVAGVLYYIKTHREVKKVAKRAKGRK